MRRLRNLLAWIFGPAATTAVHEAVHEFAHGLGPTVPMGACTVRLSRVVVTVTDGRLSSLRAVGTVVGNPAVTVSSTYRKTSELPEWTAEYIADAGGKSS